MWYGSTWTSVRKLIRFVRCAAAVKSAIGSGDAENFGKKKCSIAAYVSNPTPVGVLDLFEHLGVDLRRLLPRPPLELRVDAELHRAILNLYDAVGEGGKLLRPIGADQEVVLEP